MDWIPDLGALLAEACRDQTMSGRQWFWLPPLALTGATPDEARFVARRLARLAGVPFVTMDVGTLQSGALSRSAPRGPDVRFPPHPVIALAASGCANPIILVLGAEQAPEDVALALGDLLDRESSSRWYCQAIGAVLDLSSISWMVAATSEHSLPSALYTRLAPLRIAVPLEPPHRRLRVLAAALEVLEDAEVEVSDVAPVLASLTDDDRTWSFFERASADRLEIDLRRHLLHAANVSLR
ncbi:hypothetical protein [Sphingomonas sp. BK069]|uniref:hypothetical protein n=1 Tax=Sphingomonas sp. BK069 TaxID=2586979 RepID=UPI00160BE2C0|nr:hypothetical protein [Sphingomonas sp. BK069]MBB3348396.1 hypothetical protein [Sphingomonas sp. BK069]